MIDNKNGLAQIVPFFHVAFFEIEPARIAFGYGAVRTQERAFVRGSGSCPALSIHKELVEAPLAAPLCRRDGGLPQFAVAPGFALHAVISSPTPNDAAAADDRLLTRIRLVGDRALPGSRIRGCEDNWLSLPVKAAPKHNGHGFRQSARCSFGFPNDIAGLPDCSQRAVRPGCVWFRKPPRPRVFARGRDIEREFTRVSLLPRRCSLLRCGLRRPTDQPGEHKNSAEPAWRDSGRLFEHVADLSLPAAVTGQDL